MKANLSGVRGQIMNRGFTLVEVLVAVGILVLVAGLFASSVLDLKVSENEFTDKNDALLFVNSLTTALLENQNTCSGFISGKNLPAPGAAAIPFSITAYSGYGGNGGPIEAGSIITGTAANPSLRVRSLSINAKNVPDTTVTSGGVNFLRRIAVLTISLERRNRKISGQFIPLADRFIEFPVYVNSGGVMSSCQLEMQPADVCQMIGATVASGACKPAFQCQLKGTYVQSTCSPAYSGCPANTINPVTGGANCPPDATATQTGVTSGTFTVSCGKKCSYDVTNTMTFWICMRCS